MGPLIPIQVCTCCGSKELTQNPVLWPTLIADWDLSESEVEYVNRQQGLRCAECKCSLRSMALASAIMRTYGVSGLFQECVGSEPIQNLKIAEINPAGELTPYLSQIPGHTLKLYPETDLMRLSMPDASFDLVVHSDTLEHVSDPVAGLAECYRVLKAGGYCIFTVPIVVDRLSISRQDRSPSYHGWKDEQPPDFLVQTEYGADAWKQVIQAGFCECRIFSLEYPAAQALIGCR